METLLLRADASEVEGSGHVMRALAVAQAWQEAGGRALLLSHRLDAALQERLGGHGVAVVPLGAEPGSPEDADETARAADERGAAWISADSYRLDAAWQDRVKASGHRLLFFDDNGHCDRYAADLVLNQNAHAWPDLYAHRSPDTTLLLGPRFALLRREFRRRLGGGRATPTGSRPRVVLTFGGSDLPGATGQALAALQPLARKVELRVIIGGHNPHRADLQRAVQALPNASFVVDTSDMAAELAQATVALTSAGTTSYELAAMGIPAVLLTTFDNQRASAARLDQLGVARVCGDPSPEALQTAAQAVAHLLLDPRARERLSSAGRALVDGHGAARLIDRMRGQGRLDAGRLHLAEATWADRGRLWSQANDPGVRAQAFHPGPIPWTAHLAWLRRCLDADDAHLLCAHLDSADGPDAGVVRFDRRPDGDWESTVALAPEQRGRGLGAGLIARACRWLADTEGEPPTVAARLRVDNAASRAAFNRAGFTDEEPVAVGEIDAVQVWWRP